MAVKKVRLTGFDDLGDPAVVDWAFNDDGSMIVDIGGGQVDQLEISDGNADGYQYFGRAVTGSLTSAASWQIRRWNLTGFPIVTEYADGDSLYDNVWDNRTSLSYA